MGVFLWARYLCTFADTYRRLLTLFERGMHGAELRRAEKRIWVRRERAGELLLLHDTLRHDPCNPNSKLWKRLLQGLSAFFIEGRFVALGAILSWDWNDHSPDNGTG